MSVKIIVTAFIFSLVILGGGVILATRGQKPEAGRAVYTDQDTEKPKAEINTENFDIGEMKVSDVGRKEYPLKNTGSKPLQILAVSSSCNCTAGQIVYNGVTSREYGMHAPGGYVTEIAPGETATVRVIYRPAIMPVYGTVGREVYVTTNDPQKSRLVFPIKAFVK